MQVRHSLAPAHVEVLVRSTDRMRWLTPHFCVNGCAVIGILVSAGGNAEEDDIHDMDEDSLSDDDWVELSLIAALTTKHNLSQVRTCHVRLSSSRVIFSFGCNADGMRRLWLTTS
jgi:hypothetical protein